MALVLLILIVLFAVGSVVIFSDDFQERISVVSINEDRLKTLIDGVGLEGVSFISQNNSCATILDEEKSEVHIIYSIEQNHNKIHSYHHRTVKFSEIISSEVIIDNNTITSTSRGSQVAGGVIGGLALGGVGAIVGGLSGKTKGVENVKRVDIKLTLNNLTDPICKINFLDGDDKNHSTMKHGFKKDSEEHKNAIREAERWQGIFDIILQNQVVSS